MLEQLSISFVGGILPALVWLLFWIREDRKHPEPLRLLILTFLGGMLAVMLALKLESIIYNTVGDETTRLVLWAIVEELVKFFIAYIIVLRRKEVDEPIDYVVYMLTAALGFSALENALFLFNPVSKGLVSDSLLTGNLRFIGATLLHIVASSAVGVGMALSFYKNAARKRAYLAIGLILATALHAGFNIAIMIGDGRNSLLASSLVWIATIGVILLFEKVKKVHPTINNH